MSQLRTGASGPVQLSVGQPLVTPYGIQAQFGPRSGGPSGLMNP